MKNFWSSYTKLLGATIFHPQYFMRKYTTEGYYSVIKQVQKKHNLRLIDLGAGDMPFRQRIEEHVETYTTVDHPSVSRLYKSPYTIDIYADINKVLPIKNNTYDIALLFQVSEYLTHISTTFSEIHRILNKGGTLYMTSPFLYPLHDIPYDTNRITKEGLALLLREAGFKKILIRTQGNFWETMAVQVNVFAFHYIFSLLKEKKTIFDYARLLLFLIVTPFIIILTNMFAVPLSFLFITRRVTNYYPLNFHIEARK